MTYIRRKEIIVVVFCLLIGFALRFYTFDRKSLWLDEIHTFNDSRDDIRGQLIFYKEHPTYLHPPLFFLLTHSFYPFTKPERDLRIIPLIFGALSIPMIYLLARSFAPNIALPCTISLTFMAYHVCLSQDGRAYSLTMFLGMLSLYLFIKYLKTSKKRYLVFVSFVFATLFYTSYHSILFIVLSQIFWFYRFNKDKKPFFYSWGILNGILLSLCLPWILFLALNYRDQPLLQPYEMPTLLSFWNILSGVFSDWAPYAPLTIASVILLISLFFFSKLRGNAILLIGVLILPIGGLFLYCKLFHISHFISSRYFINFLPLFIITLYLSLNTIEVRFEKLNKFIRFKFLFVILFIASNLVILPFYYRAEKEDFRSLVSYLKSQLRPGDKLFDGNMAHTVGILHYFGIYPEGRHHSIPYYKILENEIEFRKSFIYKSSQYTIYYARRCCTQYLSDQGRLWVIGGERTANMIKRNSRFAFKGYFDGSFLNFKKFPTDASIYLFLFDPQSPGEKGIDIPIE
jgi:uncharacterized membrane protein